MFSFAFSLISLAFAGTDEHQAAPTEGQEEGHTESEEEHHVMTLEIDFENVVELPREESDHTAFELRERLLVDRPITDRVMLSAHFVLETSILSEEAGVSEAYGLVGPTLIFGKVEVNASVGLETHHEMPLRVMSFALYRSEKIYGLALAEMGGSGPWYRGLLTYRVGHITFGARTEFDSGFGPDLGVHVGPFELWGSPMYKPGHEAGMNVVSGLNFRI